MNKRTITELYHDWAVFKWNVEDEYLDEAKAAEPGLTADIYNNYVRRRMVEDFLEYSERSYPPHILEEFVV